VSLGSANSIAISSLVAVVTFAFTLVALKIVDPFGRRRTMLVVAALFLETFFFMRLTGESEYRLHPGQAQVLVRMDDTGDGHDAGVPGELCDRSRM
jgi:hypothetical protein